MDPEILLAIQRWITKADHDLATAEKMFQEGQEYTDVVCFHCQQTAEKALKACLTYAGIHVEKTHYLPKLLDQCLEIDPTFEAFRNNARSLTDYAIEVRYIEEWKEIEMDEAKRAIVVAADLLAFVKKKLKDAGIVVL